MQNDCITACVTSFNRFHLLKLCIGSLLQTNIQLVKNIIIGEDSTNLAMKSNIEQLIRDYQRNYDKIILQFNDINRGQPDNIDKLYSMVKTPYILHVEDDYIFDGNKDFIQNAIDVLEERPDLHYVWIRKLDNYRESHNTPDARAFMGPLKTTATGVPYRDFTYTSIQLSWMPHISRLADYQAAFPNGYAPLILHGEQGSHAEGVCGKTMEGKRFASTLELGACSTYNHHANSTYH